MARPTDKGRTGAVRVDGTLAVSGLDSVWAVGDCAEIPDPDHAGVRYPPTAQHATREFLLVLSGAGSGDR